MADFRRYNQKREIIKLDLVQPSDYTDNVILCVPKFAYDVARSMLAHYGKFRTSYAVSYGDLFYELPDDTRFDEIEASIDLFLGSRDMSCDITAGLECICQQLGELTAATYASNISANYAGYPEQTGGEDGSSPPAGAGNPDVSIIDRKCKAAHFIVDNYKLMMFDLLTSSPPPWYSVGEVAAYLQSIGLKHGFAGILAQIYNGYSIFAEFIFGATIDYQAIYDDLTNNYTALVCALFNADSATSAIAAFLGELTITGDEYDAISLLLFNNIINVLWFSVSDSEEQIVNYVTTVDCDVDCGAGCPSLETDFLWLVGSASAWVDEGAYYTCTINTAPNAGYHTAAFYRSPCCLSDMYVTGISGGTWHGTQYDYYDCGGTRGITSVQATETQPLRYGFFLTFTAATVLTVRIYK
jgi:hypothetical protein